MKLRVRSTIFWPHTNEDIEDHVRRCALCQEHKASKPREPMIVGKVPTLPWEMVSADLFMHNGETYQVIVDQYSFYWDARRLKRPSAAQVISTFMDMIQHHGYPQQIRTVNGPQYRSEEFQSFLKIHDINHVTSSPFYARANEMAERAVQEAKKLIKKCGFNTPEYYAAIIEWRATPRSETLGAPCQRLMSRLLRTKVPTHTEELFPRIVDPSQVVQELRREREQQKRAYDRGTRSQREFVNGETVRVLDVESRCWTPGTIVARTQQPRSYLVKKKTSDNIVRRNKAHLRESPGAPAPGELPSAVEVPMRKPRTTTSKHQAPKCSSRTSTRVSAPRSEKRSVESEEVNQARSRVPKRNPDFVYF